MSLALPRQPSPLPASEHLNRGELLAMADDWAARLGVSVGRVQVREMRRKWGSMSSAGTLTLASDLIKLPRELVAYVVCHELLHMHVPDHSRRYRLLLSRHFPDWREREQQLAAWALVT